MLKFRSLALTASIAFGLVSSVAFGFSKHRRSQPTGNIVETLVAAGQFNTLAAALEATNLLGALQGEDPLTVFAPTDAAFAKLGDELIGDLLADPETLSQILLYHVVPGNVGLLRALLSKEADTLNGAAVSFSLRHFRPFVNDSKIKRFNIRATNGTIHVIDTVLLPPAEEEPAPTPSIPEIVAGDERFSTLLDLVVAADLVDVLASEGPFTVFAPTNEAFAKLPPETLAAVAADPELLRSVLLYHVVVGAKVEAETAVTLESATMGNGQDVSLNFDGTTLKVNDSTVTATDVQASNGVIHVIDAVLIPEL